MPAIAVGCLDRHGLVPLSHQLGDTPREITPESIDLAVELGVLLVKRIDASLGRRGVQLTTPA